MTWLDMEVPEEWFELPLDLEPSDPSVDAVLQADVEARLADDDPRLAGPAPALLPLLRAFHTEAWTSGAAAGAAHVVDLPDTRYVASLRVWLRDIDVGADARERPEALARWLAEPQPGDLSSREVRVVEQPAAPAVRVSYQADDAGGATDPSQLATVLEVVEHWFILPVAGRALEVQGRTANLVHAAGMAEAVDGIAETVSFDFTRASGDGP